MRLREGQYLHISISASAELDRLRGELWALPDEVEKATARALNRTLQSIRAEGIRISREAYTAKGADIRANTSIIRASRNRLYGYVVFQGRHGMPMGSFEATPKKTNFKGVPVTARVPRDGIAVKIKRGGQSKVRTGPGGEKSFWGWQDKRPTLFYRRKDVPQGSPNALRPLFGPSPIQVLLNKEAGERLQNRADEQFRKRLEHEVSAMLKGFSK